MISLAHELFMNEHYTLTLKTDTKKTFYHSEFNDTGIVGAKTKAYKLGGVFKRYYSTYAYLSLSRYYM